MQVRAWPFFEFDVLAARLRFLVFFGCCFFFGVSAAGAVAVGLAGAVAVAVGSAGGVLVAVSVGVGSGVAIVVSTGDGYGVSAGACVGVDGGGLGRRLRRRLDHGWRGLRSDVAVAVGVGSSAMAGMPSTAAAMAALTSAVETIRRVTCPRMSAPGAPRLNRRRRVQPDPRVSNCRLEL